MRQDRDIDRVFGEALRILGHAEFCQPVGNRRHRGSASGYLITARPHSEADGETTRQRRISTTNNGRVGRMQDSSLPGVQRDGALRSPSPEAQLYCATM